MSFIAAAGAVSDADATPVNFVTISKPVGTLKGHSMLAFLMDPSNGADPYSLAGWTDLGLVLGSGPGDPMQCLRRAAGASEPTTYTFTRTGANGFLFGAIATYSNAFIGTGSFARTASNTGWPLVIKTGADTLGQAAGGTPISDQKILYVGTLGDNVGGAVTLNRALVAGAWASPGTPTIRFVLTQNYGPALPNADVDVLFIADEDVGALLGEPAWSFDATWQPDPPNNVGVRILAGQLLSLLAIDTVTGPGRGFGINEGAPAVGP